MAKYRTLKGHEHTNVDKSAKDIQWKKNSFLTKGAKIMIIHRHEQTDPHLNLITLLKN